MKKKKKTKKDDWTNLCVLGSLDTNSQWTTTKRWKNGWKTPEKVDKIVKIKKRQKLYRNLFLTRQLLTGRLATLLYPLILY